jgi:alpha-L-fucosidase 2
MRTQKRIISRKSVTLCLFAASVLLSPVKSQTSTSEKDLKLWYTKPAADWNEALPVGNGRLGAMVFGDPVHERIQLNEESLWAGCKIDASPQVDPSTLKEIQRLILENEIKAANELANKTIMSNPGRLRSYQTLGDFFIDYSLDERLKTESDSYHRELDLASGIVKTQFNMGDQIITQEVFASAPDNLIVVKISGNKTGGLTLKAFLSRTQDATIMPLSDNQLKMTGKIVDAPSAYSGPAGIHMAFEAQISGFTTDGKLQTINNCFFVENASSVVFYITAATDYNPEKLDFDRSINPAEICTDILKSTTFSSYPEILNRHTNEYQTLFNRMDLNLHGKNMDTIPTDQRLANLRNGTEDLGLISLYFQYGRYLLISSSRAPGKLPANLQGIWNQDYQAPWESDFHTNINIQMNYWPAEVCNLPETFIPYSDFVNQLREPGRITARKMYNADGWVVHHATDAFGRTAIVSAVDVGAFPIASSWLVLQLWDHYLFSGDLNYLNTQAYPAMKEAAEFMLDFLIKDKNGRWATAPSNSPENKYLLPNGEKHMLTYSATIDIQIINELFNSIQSAAGILNMDQAFVEKLKSVQSNLPPVKVSEKYGTVQEWIEDYDESEPGHRHISQLFGVYPGTSITREDSVMFTAANKTIERRLSSGGGHTGWSRAWIINFYARLLNGDKAYEHLTLLLKKSTLNNLLDNHPPFQIDGNFGGTAGIAEMLLQSHTDCIEILPALPTAWKNGEISGLKAHGNFEMSFQWENNALTKATIKANEDKDCMVKYGAKSAKFKMKKNQVLVLNSEMRKILKK